jgi:hypothetical protein
MATQSGAYEISVMLLKEGGLTASYFENIWFFYTPVLTVVDPQINHNWGNGLITPTASEYISIRWEGRLKPQYSETFTFYVSSDDGSKLWVDNVSIPAYLRFRIQICISANIASDFKPCIEGRHSNNVYMFRQVPLIDRWDTYCNDTSSTLALMANVFYEIKMEFKQVIGNAFVRLSWASASVTKELVPSSQFYYQTQTQKSPFGIIVAPNAASGHQSIATGGGERISSLFRAAQMSHAETIVMES